MDEGIEKGDVCNRDGCTGILEEKDLERGCSCHINPPCSYCTTDKTYCEECGYDGEEEQDKYYDTHIKPTLQTGIISQPRTLDQLDGSKIDWIVVGSGNSTMTKVGVYPYDTPKKEVLAKVRGTFGGRFEYFGNGTFKYIAYTD